MNQPPDLVCVDVGGPVSDGMQSSGQIDADVAQARCEVLNSSSSVSGVVCASEGTSCAVDSDLRDGVSSNVAVQFVEGIVVHGLPDVDMTPSVELQIDAGGTETACIVWAPFLSFDEKLVRDYPDPALREIVRDAKLATLKRMAIMADDSWYDSTA